LLLVYNSEGPIVRELPDNLAPERVLDARQGAALFGVSIATWRRMARAGKLPPAIRLSKRRLGWRTRDLLDALRDRAA
jgi:predicted DNA-binding transcriptional regulator AlpA